METIQQPSYWAERFRMLEERSYKKTQTVTSIARSIFEDGFNTINNKIEEFIARYAKNGRMSITEATEYLTSGEFIKHKMELERYIQLGQQNAINYSEDIARELEAASLEFRMTRLAALENELAAEISNMYGMEHELLFRSLGDLYQDNYAHTAFEIFKGTGVIDTTFAMPNADLIDSVLRTPWSADGGTFSMGIWFNQHKLIRNVRSLLVQQFIHGYGYDRTAGKLYDIFGKSYRDSERLIRTESAFFQGEAQFQCFKRLDVEQYQFLAEFDTKTCEVCQSLDGMVFNMDERSIGDNYEPIHPNCRCVCAPYMDYSHLPGYVEASRAGRDLEGNYMTFPESWKYKDWEAWYNTQALPNNLPPINFVDVVVSGE